MTPVSDAPKKRPGRGRDRPGLTTIDMSYAMSGTKGTPTSGEATTQACGVDTALGGRSIGTVQYGTAERDRESIGRERPETSKLSREENTQAERILEDFDGLIQGIARKRLIPGIDFEDLLQVGRLAALKAVENYNPHIGTLRGWVGLCASNAMFDLVRDSHSTIRIPRHHFGRIWRSTTPLDAPFTDEGRCITEVIPEGPETERCDVSELELLEAALAKLPIRQQAAIRGRFWDQVTFRELGEQHCCRGSYMQQLEAKALISLRVSPEIRKIKEGRAA